MSKKLADPSQEAGTLTVFHAVAVSLVTGLVGGIFGYCQVGNSGQTSPFVASGIGFVAGVGLGFFVVWSRNKSSNQLKAWCRANGWIWIGSRSPFKRAATDFHRTLQKSHIFWRMGSFEDSTVRDGSDVAAAVCSKWRDRNNDNREYVGFLVLRYQGECPDITIEPHHLGDFISEIGSRSKVEFESAAFNKKWRVLSVDPKAAYDRIDQSTIEFLNESHLSPAIEFVDELLILRVHHRIKTPEAHERLIRWVERFSAAVPDDLMAPVELLPPVRA
jgi:hypothetical protein